MSVIFNDWGANATENLSFMRNATALLRTNASRSQDAGLRSRAELLASAVFAMSTATPVGEFIDALNQYTSIRDALGTDVYEAPPIDVIVPAAVQPRVAAPAEMDVDAAVYQGLETQSDSLLRAGDPLRTAIHGWRDWYDHITFPASTNERTRSKRLAAWARDRLALLNAQRAAGSSPAAPILRPREDPNRPYQSASNSGGLETLFKVGLGFVAIKALGKIFRKGRR